MSSRAAAAATDKSKMQTSVMPTSQTSVKNDSQPSQKLPKRFAFSVSYLRYLQYYGRQCISPLYIVQERPNAFHFYLTNF